MFKNFKSNYYKEHRSEYLYFLEGTIFTIMIIFIKYISREAESENASLVVQGMLMEFDCRFLKRMVWCISFDIWLCLNVVHSYGIHGNT